MASIKKNEKGGILGAALIISGCSIGGGMLALPSATGEAGFFPSLATNFICWLYSMLTGLFLMEACLWAKTKNLYLPSLAEEYFGKWGKAIVCVLFIFLYECLLVSYFSGGIPSFHTLTMTFLPSDFAWDLNFSYVLFSLLIAFVIIMGTKWIDRVNLILMVSLVLSFIFLLNLGASEVRQELLIQQKWSKILLSLPILIGAYGFHNVVPSLVFYLDRDVKSLRKAIIIGTTLPLLAYSCWQWLTLGSIPFAKLDEFSGQAGIPVIESLIHLTGSNLISSVALFFTSFAILTSLLGVAFSMVDFLGDLLKVDSQGRQRSFLCLLTLLPPLVIGFFKPNLFVKAFGFAAGFGEATLNGLVPIFLIWVGVYKFGRSVTMPILKRKILLQVMTFLTLVIIGIEIYSL